METKYISLEEAIDCVIGQTCWHYNDSMIDEHGIISSLRRLRAADVVEVVRCKDCLHHRRNGTCEITPAFAYMSDTDFCSHGKRRKRNDN